MNKPLKSPHKDLRKVRSMITACSDLHYQLKIHATLKGKKIYDLTDQAIREFLEREGGT